MFLPGLRFTKNPLLACSDSMGSKEPIHQQCLSMISAVAGVLFPPLQVTTGSKLYKARTVWSASTYPIPHIQWKSEEFPSVRKPSPLGLGRARRRSHRYQRIWKPVLPIADCEHRPEKRQAYTRRSIPRTRQNRAGDSIWIESGRTAGKVQQFRTAPSSAESEWRDDSR